MLGLDRLLLFHCEKGTLPGPGKSSLDGMENIDVLTVCSGA